MIVWATIVLSLVIKSVSTQEVDWCDYTTCPPGWPTNNYDVCVKCIRCAAHSHWNSCGSYCPKTCAPLGPHPTCPTMCLTGCECDAGYARHNGFCIPEGDCPIDIDDCASNPCVHGSCADGLFKYTCSCALGWAGVNCDLDIDECASNPCWLGGTCLDHVDGYSSVCPKGTTGKHCETAVFEGECYEFSSDPATHSDATLACQIKDGNMVDVTHDRQQQFLADNIALSSGVSNWLAMKAAPLGIIYSDGSPFSAPFQWSASEAASRCVLLDSNDNFLGKTAPCTDQHNYVCQDALTSCQPNVCQNGGNCTSCFGESTTFCECADGFEGKFCEINIDECASNPCQNSGNCQDGVNSYSCSCLLGFQGAHCETAPGWCDQAQCPNGMTCEDHIFYFLCTDPASSNRVAPYECSSASCPDGMYCTKEGVASFSCKAV
ncbi:uncharacterized protein LOC144864957 [Branchiostoma floridae x Branchiostoma japonicum]